MSRAMRLVIGGFAAVLITPWIGGVVANASNDTTPVSGDPRATVGTDKNAVTCADVGFPNDQLVGASEKDGLNADGFAVSNDGTLIDVTALPAGVSVDVFVVKGADAYNLYPGSLFTSLPVNDMHAPINASGGPAGVSHWFLCYGATPPVITPPAATSTGDCDGADLTLNAGTLPAVFTVDRAGDATGQTYSLAGGASQVVHVTLDAVHSSVSAAAGGPALTTFTRANDICDRDDNGGGGDNNGNGGGDNNGNGGGGDNNGGGDNGNGGGNGGGGGVTSGPGPTGGSGGSTSGGAVVTNPAVSASNACRTGITVSLSNLAATAPVSFTLTAPDGTVSTETVDAGDTATRSFPVTEDTTGTLTVSAPGLPARTFTYAKDCVTVLGVKHTRHHATHRATQHEAAAVIGTRAQLPFTGFNSRRTATDGALVLGLGIILCLVAGRRERSAA